jgi:hypothetical protein
MIARSSHTGDGEDESRAWAAEAVPGWLFAICVMSSAVPMLLRARSR